MFLFHHRGAEVSQSFTEKYEEEPVNKTRVFSLIFSVHLCESSVSLW